MPMLQGQTAFITGAASGIGKATAIRFAREGANVGIADMQEQEKEARAVIQEIEKLGVKAIFIPTDVSQPDQVKHAIDETVRTFGGLNIVFANAGLRILGVLFLFEPAAPFDAQSLLGDGGVPQQAPE